MKRPIFLIIATVLVLILAGVWVYVLLYGNPENLGERFTDFNLGDTTDTDVIPEPTPEPEPVVDVQNDESLRQLTTNPIVGFQHVQATPTSTPYVYYIEAGTGHIFSINTETGEEARISRTTIPNATAAKITPDGLSVMITTGQGGGQETLFGRLSNTSDTLLTNNIGDIAVDIHPTTENTFLYLTRNVNTATVKEYNPTTNTSETLFTIPFRQGVVSWGDTASDVHYIYPKASRYMEGSLFKFEDGIMSRTPISGFGLSANGVQGNIIYSTTEGGNYITNSFNISKGEETYIPYTVVPEKCAILTRPIGVFICAQPINIQVETLPGSWYRGETISSDSLAQVSANSGSVSAIVNFSDLGRTIDAVELLVANQRNSLLFKNKIDNTLWIYNLTY